MRASLILVPLIALAACGSSEPAAVDANAVSAAPVDAVTAPAGKAWAETVTRSAEGGYVLGNPNAPIKLVEYGSRSCPTCARFKMEGMEPLRTKYIPTGKVSYEFRDFLVHGAPDLAIALLNQCVPDEAFFTVLDQVFENQNMFLQRLDELQRTNPALIQQLQSQAPATAAAGFAEAVGYLDFIKQRGVPEDRARACLTDKAKIDSIAKIHSDAANVHRIAGTPTFLINGKVIPNAPTWGLVEPALIAAGAR